jgi:membrane protease YdiL (CAAX protease family)
MNVTSRTPLLERNTALQDRLAVVPQWLRRTAWARSALYFGTAVGILQWATARYPADTQAARLATHLTAWPLGAVLTYAMYRLEGRTVRLKLTPAERRALAGGALLGASAFGAVVASAAAQGWVQSPTWGWAQTDRWTLGKALIAHGVGQAAAAWNEEMVFRGYGLAVLEEAIGQPAASAVLVALFAFGHPGSVQVWIGQAIAGTTLLVLRLATGNIWAAVGYHWAWNVAQTAILGPNDGMPSLRPLINTGPEAWIGRPGHPEPGLLSALVQAGMAAAIAAVGWLRTRRKR